MDVEAVREGECRALLDVRLDFGFINRGDVLVGHEHHHQIGAFHGIGDRCNLEPRLLRLVPRRATRTQTDGHLHAGIVEILRVRVALRAVADDRDLLALDQRQVGVFFIIDFHCDSFLEGADTDGCHPER